MFLLASEFRMDKIMSYLDGQMASMEEIANPFIIIVIGFRLRQFIVVVRELEIHASSVDVHRRSEDGGCHYTALDMPSRTTWAKQRM